MFFLRQCWTCSTEFWLKSKALVRLQSIVVKISKSTGSHLLSWVCLKLLKILKGICYFPSFFLVKLPFGDVPMYPCEVDLFPAPLCGRWCQGQVQWPVRPTPLGRRNMGKVSVFMGGFQGGTLGNSSNWRIFPWTQGCNGCHHLGEHFSARQRRRFPAHGMQAACVVGGETGSVKTSGQVESLLCCLCSISLSKNV